MTNLCKLCASTKFYIRFLSLVLSRNHGDIKKFICPFDRPSVCHKNFNLAHIFWSINNRLLIFFILVRSPFSWHHALTFDLLQGQVCFCSSDHNSPNLRVFLKNALLKLSATFVGRPLSERASVVYWSGLDTMCCDWTILVTGGRSLACWSRISRTDSPTTKQCPHLYRTSRLSIRFVYGRLRKIDIRMMNVLWS